MIFKTLFFTACVLAAGAAAAQQTSIKLRTTPPIAKNVEAYPRLVSGAPPAVIAKINKALQHGEALLRAARKACVKDGHGHADWSRKLSVTMAGPGFLSLVARDDYDCGGAHPNVGALALAYDLQTGKPVDLVKLLPGLKLTGGLDDAADGSKIGTIASAELTALYKKAPKPGLDPECAGALDNQDLIFIAWPDSKARGLVIEPENLPHVVAACGVDVTLDIDALKAAQAAPELVDALAAGK
jgi:hypothetical protein